MLYKFVSKIRRGLNGNVDDFCSSLMRLATDRYLSAIQRVFATRTLRFVRISINFFIYRYGYIIFDITASRLMLIYRVRDRKSTADTQFLKFYNKVRRS